MEVRKFVLDINRNNNLTGAQWCYSTLESMMVARGFKKSAVVYQSKLELNFFKLAINT